MYGAITRMRTRWPWAIILGMLIGVTLLLAGCRPDVPAPVRPIKAEVGYSAPDFQLTDLNGRQVRLSDFRGKPVVLNFWATWCPPCRQELPIFQDLHARRGDAFVLLAISEGENREDVLAFVQRYGYTFRVLLDPQLSVGRTYGARAIPMTMVIDPDGVIVYLRQGTVKTGELDLVLREYIR